MTWGLGRWTLFNASSENSDISSVTNRNHQRDNIVVVASEVQRPRCKEGTWICRREALLRLEDNHVHILQNTRIRRSEIRIAAKYAIEWFFCVGGPLLFSNSDTLTNAEKQHGALTQQLLISWSSKHSKRFPRIRGLQNQRASLILDNLKFKNLVNPWGGEGFRPVYSRSCVDT